MGCSSCSSGSNGTPAGCGSKGGCSTGGCNKLNTYDWLSHIDLPDYGNYDLVEVSFKNGSRKEIYKKPEFVYLSTGDYVAVESTANGYDIGQISLMGELVQLQLKKYRIKDNTVLPNILRMANERDLERLNEARLAEREAMIQARVIVRDLKLDMKIGDVEFQGDKRKVTFYYTAEGRVDFRELIRIFAKEYKVKIEMRQIGARQESARIGGIGSCGRELCCSTWLTDFKSVSTVAARYQNLAINQSKLSGQCGRLKCCLNYELSTYLEVLQEFPKNVNTIKTKKGTAILIKTDIFKRIMYFAFRGEFGLSEIHQLSTVQVKELHEMNQNGILPENLKDFSVLNAVVVDEEDEDMGFVDGAGSLELKQLDSSKKKKRSKSRKGKSNSSAENNVSDNKISENKSSDNSVSNKPREKKLVNKPNHKPSEKKTLENNPLNSTKEKSKQDSPKTETSDKPNNNPNNNPNKKKRPNKRKPNPNRTPNAEENNNSNKPEVVKQPTKVVPVQNDSATPNPNPNAKSKNNSRNKNRNRNRNKNRNNDSKPTNNDANNNNNNNNGE